MILFAFFLNFASILGADTQLMSASKSIEPQPVVSQNLYQSSDLNFESASSLYLEYLRLHCLFPFDRDCRIIVA